MNANSNTGRKNETQILPSFGLDQFRKVAAQLAQAKENLIAEFKETLDVQEKLLKLAVNEAEALAWETEYPQLFFPVLALEKAQVAASWQSRQSALRTNKQTIAFAA